MALSQLTAAALLAAYGFAVVAAGLHVDLYKDDADPAKLRHNARKLNAAANTNDDVCYEGCFAAPVGELEDPLPVFLLGIADTTGNGAGPLSLLDCYTAAVEAGVTYFAIVDKTDCFGGNTTLQGWAPDSCPLDCVPDGNSPNACGDANKASLFSMGLCQYIDAPCAPAEGSPPPPALPASPPPPHTASPSPPSGNLPPPPRSPAIPNNEQESSPPVEEPPSRPEASPPLRSPPPSPKPSPPGKQYSCKPGVALWGSFLSGSPLKLNPTHSAKANTAECQRLCSVRGPCKGYYYKTTGWCYLMSEVYSFGKEYSTAVQACKAISS